MKLNLGLSALLIAFPLMVGAQDLSLDLRLLNPDLLIGEPLRVEISVRNKSQKPIRISFTASSQYGGAPSSFLAGTGKTQQCGSNGLGYSRTADFSFPDAPGEPIDTPPGKAIHFVDTILCSNLTGTKAGDYEIFTKFVGPGRSNLNNIEGQPPKYFCEGCWKGVVESPRIKVHFDEPSKEDREALTISNEGSSASRDARLLNKYPTSRFAAYVILHQCGQFPLSDYKFLVYSLASDHPIEGRTNVPDDTLTNNNDPNHWQSLTYKDAAEWRKRWINISLENHPNIWFADDLRLQLAIDQIFLKNYKEGAAMLDNLAKDPKSRVAGKATEFLSLLREKKLVP